jgi:hypothetical protein
MFRRSPHRLILCNDGGSLVGPTVEAPIGADGLAQLVVGPLKATQVDTLYWQLGTDPYLGTPTHRLTDQYSHNTSVGPRWGQGGARFTSAANWRIYENTRQLRDAGTDPAEVVIEQGHCAGLDVFLSMRVNDIHDSNLCRGLQDPLLSPMKRDHPGWLLGGEGRASTGYNFAVQEVRDYKLALALEAIANYDLDGLDWDFCRYPRFFAEGEEQQGALLMTDLLRELHAAVSAKGGQVGRPVLLSVRVPGSLASALSKGLDVCAWIEEGLVDIVIVGHSLGNKHRLPVEEYVDVASDTDTQVVVQNLGLFMQPRPLSAKILWHERDFYSTEMCRATAAMHWRAGAQGIYLFNNHLIPYVRDLNYDRQAWMEIANPHLIAQKNKHYVLDESSWGEGLLPVALHGIGDQTELAIDVADDLAAATRDEVLRHATLRLLIEHLTDLDDLRFEINGQTLDRLQARKRLHYNDAWLEFDARPPMLHQGWNSLTVRVDARNPSVDCPLSLRSVEVLIGYYEAPVS